jgi:hypothetical protein
VSGKHFAPKKDEVSEKFRILHNEEIGDAYRSPCIVRTVKTGQVRCTGCGRGGTYTEYWWRYLWENVRLENRERDESTTSSQIFGK